MNRMIPALTKNMMSKIIALEYGIPKIRSTTAVTATKPEATIDASNIRLICFDIGNSRISLRNVSLRKTVSVEDHLKFAGRV